MYNSIHARTCRWNWCISFGFFWEVGIIRAWWWRHPDWCFSCQQSDALRMQLFLILWNFLLLLLFQQVQCDQLWHFEDVAVKIMPLLCILKICQLSLWRQCHFCAFWKFVDNATSVHSEDMSIVTVKTMPLLCILNICRLSLWRQCRFPFQPLIFTLYYKQCDIWMEISQLHYQLQT